MKEVLYDSEESAKFQTVEGWVSRMGRFFGKDERTARWDGCTHKKCKTCETIIIKDFTYCKECADKILYENYLKLPYENWNEIDVLYSMKYDTFFYSKDEVFDFVYENGIKDLDNLYLVITDKNYFWKIDPYDIYSNILDGVEIPYQIEKAFDELNIKIEDYKYAISYNPLGKKRTSIKL